MISLHAMPIRGLHEEGLMFYISLEVCSFVAYICSTTLFLMIRSCLKHKISAEHEVSQEKRVPDCDFMIGCFMIADTFVNAVFPSIMLILIAFMPD